MKVLISRPDKIGDVVLALHAVKQLKLLKPEFEVYLHIAKYTEDLVKNINFLDGYLTLEDDLDAHDFDVVVDLMAKKRTARTYVLPSIPERIGNSARWFSFLYTKTRFVRRSHALLNEAEYNWQLISLLDKDLKNTRLNCSLAMEDFSNIQPWLIDEQFTVIMPGVTVSAVGWSAKNWLELGKLLSRSQKVYFLLGPAEKDLLNFYKESCKDCDISVVTPENFETLMGLLDACSTYIGPSTGITHLAALAGCRGVALYPEQQSMHPSRWAPFKGALKLVSLDKKPTPSDVTAILEQREEVYRKYNPLDRSKVSAFVVCFNEEKNIRRCLESIAWCDEIVVVDSESTDRTREICSEYTDKVIVRPWEGHRQQKQFALDQCAHQWVLNIDSDEEVSAELRGQLLRILKKYKDTSNPVKGYQLSRVVYFLDRWWEKGGWYPEYRMRFFQKAYTRWGGVNPHEKAIVNGKTGKLKGNIYHFTYSGFHHQIDSLNKHSSSSAKFLYESGKRCHLHNLILNPFFRFFKFYVIKLGFREGLTGLLVGTTEALQTFLKYLKLWELQKRNSKSSG